MSEARLAWRLPRLSWGEYFHLDRMNSSLRQSTCCTNLTPQKLDESHIFECSKHGEMSLGEDTASPNVSNQEISFSI